MAELVTQFIFLIATIAFVALVAGGGYAAIKIGTFIGGHPVDVDTVYFFGGALVAISLLPSNDHTTVESRFLLVAAASIAGSFLGGVVGLFVHLYLSRKRSANSAIRAEDEALSGRRQTSKAVYALARFIVLILIVVSGAVVVAARFGDVPILGTITTFLARFFK